MRAHGRNRCDISDVRAAYLITIKPSYGQIFLWDDRDPDPAIINYPKHTIVPADRTRVDKRV